jgi:outer membrane immunogenic protein
MCRRRWPIWSWTGFYVGANVGYSWGQSSNSWNVFAPNFTTGDINCIPAGGAFCLSWGDSNKMNGAIGGFQAGYNWQSGNWLVGIETDFDLSGQRGSQTFATGFIIGGGTTGIASAAYSEKLAWLGTLRGRFGITADRLLFYGTGGLAYGHITSDGSATATGFLSPFVPPSPPCSAPGTLGACPLAAFSTGTTKVGWN